MRRSKSGWILLEGLVGISVMVLFLAGVSALFREGMARYRSLVKFDGAVLEAQGEIERAVVVGGTGKKTVMIDGSHRLEVILAP